MKKILYLVDTYSIIFRAYYAIPALYTSSGFQTNAVFGVIKSIIKLREKFNPEFMCAVYDSIGKTFRKEIAEDYKANRVKAPDDLKKQFPIIENIVKNFGIPSIRIEGYEADDVLAAITKKLKDKFDEIVILTGDKDLFQLIDDRVAIFDPKYNKWYHRKETYEKFGVWPEQIKDFLSLVGDASDNIKGAPGIGKKTAAKLLNEYTNLDNIYINKEKLGNGIQRSLEEFAKYKDVSVKLITMKTDLPINGSMEYFGISEPEHNKLIEEFQNLEFHSLIKELHLNLPTSFIEFLPIEKFKRTDIIFFKIIDDKVIALNSNGTVSIFELFQFEFDANSTYISYDIKSDFKFLIENNILLPKKYFDLLIAHHILKGGKKILSYDDLIMDYPVSNLMQFKDKINLDIKILEEIKKLYHISQIYKEMTTYQTFELMYEKVLKPIELPLIPILANMELKGIKIDMDIFGSVKKEYQKMAKDLEKEIIELCGEPFNIDSPKQLGQILFYKLDLPIIKKMKTGPSTNNSVLNALIKTTKNATHFQILKSIISYREIAKLLNTYLVGFEKHITHESHKIHTTFYQSVTATGRLSSENPNLQNIPIRSEKGSIMRKMFIPSKANYSLLSLDYSQIELRVLAVMTKDKNLMDGFKQGLDIHIHTASKILSIPIEKVGKKERSIGKTINYAVIYGMSAYHLSQRMDISMNEAQAFIDTYYKEYSGVKKFKEELIEEAEKKGYVETYFGRRRYIPELLSRDKNIQNSGIRIAVNAPVQGTASEIVKLAMIKIEGKQFPIDMLLQIHDELIFEGETELLEKYSSRIAEIMETIVNFGVDLKVDYNIGKNWLDIH